VAVRDAPTNPQVHIDHLHRRHTRRQSTSLAAVRCRTSASTPDVPRRSPTGSCYRRALFAVTSRPSDRKFEHWVQTGIPVIDCRAGGRCRQTCPPGGASPAPTWCCRGRKDTSLRHHHRRRVQRGVVKVSRYTLKFDDRRRHLSTVPHSQCSPSTADGRPRASRVQEELTQLVLDVQSTSRHHTSTSSLRSSATRRLRAQSCLSGDDTVQRPRQASSLNYQSARSASFLQTHEHRLVMVGHIAIHR